MIKKILITGGHPSPALALIEELKKRGSYTIVFVGRRRALSNDRSLSYEFREIKKMGINFVPITAGKLSRFFSWTSVISLIKIPIGFMQSFSILMHERPNIIISFGGHIALPLVIVGAILGIPAITHEQTLSPGITTKIISLFCKKICVTWEQAKKSFPKDRVIVTGNPIRSSLFSRLEALPVSHNTKPLLYITGGGTGSHAINVAVKENFFDLVKRYRIIHQTGSSSNMKDFEMLSKLKDKLSPTAYDDYVVYEYLSASQVGWIYGHADLVISRSGANTTYELIYFGLPSVLVPLPWSGNNEQQAQANFLKEIGMSQVLNQRDLKTTLLFSIQSMIKHLHEHKFRAQEARKFTVGDGAKKMANLVVSSIP